MNRFDMSTGEPEILDEPPVVTPEEEVQPTDEVVADTQEQANAVVEDATEEASAEDTSEEPKGKTPHRLQKRIDKLSARAKAAEAELAELKAKMTVEPKGAEPDPADFDSFDDYEAALEKWKKPSEAKPDTTLVKARQQITWQLEEWDDAPEDFVEVVSKPDLPIPTDVLVLLADMDLGAQVLYHLGQNPGKAEKIARMLTSERKAKALDMIEAELMGKPVAQTKPVSVKPSVQPIEPVGGSSAPTQSKDYGKMSESEYIETRNKEGSSRFW